MQPQPVSHERPVPPESWDAHKDQFDFTLYLSLHHAKMGLMPFSAIIGADELAHVLSLYRSYAVCYKVVQGFGASVADRVAPDPTA
ncbi:hypothetical protein DPMN_136535 [Dreissena polymorpha]|uniref:Uncharacterized protein n=1 Tax=Dreissena polymorpha TaxID=45954 RepID=A0A9D4G2Z9_DREPO|nr:hypothetical protein DPMN_136535 [Dreissena polymorpha]